MKAAKLDHDDQAQAVTVVGSSRKRKAVLNSPVQEGSKRRQTKHSARPAANSSRKRPKQSSAKKSTTASRHVSRPVLSSAPTETLVVAVFGTGDCGELGLGPKNKETLVPRINQFLDTSSTQKSFDVVQLDCGGMHVIALTKNNQIITWGVNDKGALGRNTEWEGGMRDVDAESSDSDDDEPLNPLESTPAEVPSKSFPPGTKFTRVAAGDSCSFALTDTGHVYGWGTFLNSEGKSFFGYDDAGQLVEVQYEPRLITGLSKIIQLTCGANHGLALDTSGNVWGWGIGEQNQLGRRLLQRRALQALIPRRVEVCRNSAKYIASGLYHSFAIDRHDNVWAWGLDSYGQAGGSEGSREDPLSIPRPVKIPDLSGQGVTVLSGGQHHSAAITANGRCLLWGRVDGGQLGIKFTDQQLADETLIIRDIKDKPRICTRPTAVTSFDGASYVSCGTGHTIFISTEGKAFGAGFGTMGQLGMGDEDEVAVAQPVKGKAVKEKFLTWAGTGGQFSVVAGHADGKRSS